MTSESEYRHLGNNDFFALFLFFFLAQEIYEGIFFLFWREAVFEKGSCHVAKVASNSQQSCLAGAGIAGGTHHA